MSRHIDPPEGNPINPTIELYNSLTKLITLYPPSSLDPSGGLYAGLLSVTYLFWKLLKVLPPEWTLNGRTVRDWFNAYWTRAKLYDASLLGERGIEGLKIRPWRCGVGEDTIVYAALCVVVALEDRHPDAEDQARAFCRAVKQVVGEASRIQEQRHGKPASNEWLYGRSGSLYLLRMIRHVAKDRLPNSGTIVSEIDDTIRELIEEIVAAPRPWVWHGKAYLGAVHGSAGIIYQVVESMNTIGLKDQRLLGILQTDVKQLLDLQLPSGNWPSSIPAPSSQTRDHLVQFCHGSPGIIPCLQHIKSSYPRLSQRIATAISSAESDILARGWLTKEPSLCHGATGNAMSLSSMDDRMRFLSGTTEEMVEELQEAGVVGRSDSPEGLWTGIAGRVWAWGLCVVGEENLQDTGSFLGFDDV